MGFDIIEINLVLFQSQKSLRLNLDLSLVFSLSVEYVFLSIQGDDPL